MKQPSQEDLLGYVLGALDAQQHREVQQLIDNNPDLEEQLLQIRNALLPLDLVDQPAGPPTGLARRTCEMVATFQKQGALDSRSPTDDSLQNEAFANRTAGLSPSGYNFAEPEDVPFAAAVTADRLAPSSGWSRSDFLVGVAVIAIIVGISLPAVSYSRHHLRIIACQRNMVQLGQAFLSYSNMNPEGSFVEIPESGNLSVSGCYAPVLKQAGLIENDEVVRCAGVSQQKLTVIPSCDRVESASGETLKRFQQTMGGDYGYSLGYLENNRYQTPRYEGRPNVVLLADRPSDRCPVDVAETMGVAVRIACSPMAMSNLSADTPTAKIRSMKTILAGSPRACMPTTA